MAIHDESTNADSGVALGTVIVEGAKPYQVLVGRGVMARVADLVPEAALRVVVFHPPAMIDRAETISAAVVASGRETVLVELPDGEEAKTAKTLVDCWELLGKAGITRTDAAIAVGGGATTDLAGFVAATWLRGISIVQVPTTLLAMVDAAVGGKTGINTAAGKNLVGSIYPPAAVVCDLDLLATLPAPDYAAGLAEVVKAGFIADPVILDLVEQDPGAALDSTSAVAEEIILRAIAVKARVVADDLTESVNRELGREILNYGHTLAHAIERAENYRWRHGDAVSVGMVFAAALAVAAGRQPLSELDRHRQLLSSLGLPINYPGGQVEELLDAMALDKKTRGNTLRFIILDEVGTPGLLIAPDDDVLARAFAEVC
jgi:3-dehydroquinate synthase